MARVIFENVYKSFSHRPSTESNPTLDERSQKGVNRASSFQKRQSNSVTVLRNINLEVEDGEFMVLVGPSGCGKSTLLRLLAGLEDLTGGKICIGDRTVNRIPPKARNIAMVFQNYALYPHLNVYDNIAFGLRRSDTVGGTNSPKRQGDKETGRLGVLKDTASRPIGNPLGHNWETGALKDTASHKTGETGRTRESSISNLLASILVGMTRSLPGGLRYLSPKEKAIRQQVRYVASLLKIESLLYRLPKELSGGQKQRVALGRAIARNPQVFLMDEPLSNLDAKLRTETRAQIVRLQKQLGITTIYVTHDQTEAMTMGDRIAVMEGGKIQQIASPLEIYNRPENRFVAEFIGSPPMNFLPVELIDSLTLVHPDFRIRLSESWRKVLQHQTRNKFLLGIRPQYFFVSSESSDLCLKVNLVEALGSETYIQGTLANNTNTSITATLPPDTKVVLDDYINLSINLEKIHLFDADSQVRVKL